MSQRNVLALCVAWLAWGCGGASGTAEVAHKPLEIAAAEQPAPDPQATQRAAEDCEKACQLVSGCLPDVALDPCKERCQQSRWVTPNATRCLALRVLWIDEDGCSRIVPTWQRFDEGDDCSGPPPDER